jgi:hypothetical protein
MSACSSRPSGETAATVEDGSGVAATALVAVAELARGCHGSTDLTGAPGIAPTVKLTPAAAVDGVLRTGFDGAPWTGPRDPALTPDER